VNHKECLIRKLHGATIYTTARNKATIAAQMHHTLWSCNTAPFYRLWRIEQAAAVIGWNEEGYNKADNPISSDQPCIFSLASLLYQSAHPLPSRCALRYVERLTE